MSITPIIFLPSMYVPTKIQESAIVSTGSVDFTICARLALTAAWAIHIDNVPM